MNQAQIKITFPLNQSQSQYNLRRKLKNQRLDINKLQEKLKEMIDGEISLEELIKMFSDLTEIIPKKRKHRKLENFKKFQEGYKKFEVFLKKNQ